MIQPLTANIYLQKSSASPTFIYTYHSVLILYHRMVHVSLQLHSILLSSHFPSKDNEFQEDYMICQRHSAIKPGFKSRTSDSSICSFLISYLILYQQQRLPLAPTDSPLSKYIHVCMENGEMEKVVIFVLCSDLYISTQNFPQGSLACDC